MSSILHWALYASLLGLLLLLVAMTKQNQNQKQKQKQKSSHILAEEQQVECISYLYKNSGTHSFFNPAISFFTTSSFPHHNTVTAAADEFVPRYQTIPRSELSSDADAGSRRQVVDGKKKVRFSADVVEPSGNGKEYRRRMMCEIRSRRRKRTHSASCHHTVIYPCLEIDSSSSSSPSSSPPPPPLSSRSSSSSSSFSSSLSSPPPPASSSSSAAAAAPLSSSSSSSSSSSPTPPTPPPPSPPPSSSSSILVPESSTKREDSDIRTKGLELRLQLLSASQNSALQFSNNEVQYQCYVSFIKT